MFARPFLTDAGKAALTQAVKEVEARSAAEIVVSVRPASADYWHADAVAGALAAIATLAFTLFSAYDFALSSILVDPIAVGVVAALALPRVLPLRRWLTPPAVRRARLRVAAQSTFFARGVHHTSGKTGVLVYLSLLERSACLVADRGVATRVPPARWAELEDAIARAARGDAHAVARAMKGLGDALAEVLPRADDDVNELPDEVEG